MMTSEHDSAGKPVIVTRKIQILLQPGAFRIAKNCFLNQLCLFC
jgi:hypothetical protein